MEIEIWMPIFLCQFPIRARFVALTFGKSEKAWDEQRPEGNETNHSEHILG